MSYKISYGAFIPDTLARQRSKTGKRLLALGVIGLLGTAGFLLREQLQVLKPLIYPLGDERVTQVFGEMLQQLEQGTPFAEAVTAFCREILEYGQVCA